jgi:uncharacterized protein YjaG (DUF416 family)
MHRFEREVLRRRLDALSSWAHLAFGVLLLERAVPNFFRFEAETEARGGAMLRGAQAKLWGLLEGNNAAAPFVGITAKACEFFAPDTELYSSPYTSSALDAISIACNVLDYADSERAELLVEAASLRRDSIDMFLQRVDPSAVDFEMRLLTHPLMQEELGLQEADLAFLDKWQSKGEQAWSAVLGRSVDLGYSNLRMIPPRQ